MSLTRPASLVQLGPVDLEPDRARALRESSIETPSFPLMEVSMRAPFATIRPSFQPSSRIRPRGAFFRPKMPPVWHFGSASLIWHS